MRERHQQEPEGNHGNHQHGTELSWTVMCCSASAFSPCTVLYCTVLSCPIISTHSAENFFVDFTHAHHDQSSASLLLPAMTMSATHYTTPHQQMEQKASFLASAIIDSSNSIFSDLEKLQCDPLSLSLPFPLSPNQQSHSQSDAGCARDRFMDPLLITARGEVTDVTHGHYDWLILYLISLSVP